MANSFFNKHLSPKWILWIFFASTSGLAFAAYSGQFPSILRIFWHPVFLQGIRVFCVAGFLFLILKRFAPKYFPSHFLKWLYGILFLPLLVLPIFQCYFKVPYVFCRACPQPCPWGLVRTFVFNSIILLNFSRKFWCTALCPFGTFQECQARIFKKKLRISVRATFFMASLVLLLVTVMYFLTLFQSPWLRFFELGRYDWVGATVLATGLVFLLSFLIPKFGCRFFCPFSAITGLIDSFKKTS